MLPARSTKRDGREEKLGGTLSNIYQYLPREMAGKTSWVVLSARSAKRDGREEKLGGTLSNIYQERDGREDKLGGTLSNIFQERWTG